MAGFFLNSAYTFEIGDDVTTLNTLGAGLSEVDVQNNEETDQTAYLDGDGFLTTDVIGAQLTFEFTGHRLYGDVAQDFVFGKVLSLGSARNCHFSVTDPEGGIFAGPATVTITSGIGGGAANAKSEISFGVHFNGKPEYTEPPVPVV